MMQNENPIFPKLNEVAVTYNPWPISSNIETKNRTYDGLTYSDQDPPIEYILKFVSAVHQHAIFTKTPPLVPSDIAKSAGLEKLTFTEYVDALRNNGIDIQKLHELTLQISREYELSLIDRNARATKFFQLIRSQWLISDEEVRNLIDAESIIDLLEIVLAHADTTRARLKAIKRHAENHALKADVFFWLDSQTSKFKSNEAAATAITRQQPIAHVTARSWFKEWKKIRSASTP